MRQNAGKKGSILLLTLGSGCFLQFLSYKLIIWMGINLQNKGDGAKGLIGHSGRGWARRQIAARLWHSWNSKKNLVNILTEDEKGGFLLRECEKHSFVGGGVLSAHWRLKNKINHHCCHHDHCTVNSQSYLTVWASHEHCLLSVLSHSVMLWLLQTCGL